MKPKTETKVGWHFTGKRLRNGDPIPPIGQWISIPDGIQVVPCSSGLHMSEHPFDALTYAPGHILHRVELRGDLKSHGDPVDKWVGRERRILSTRNVEFLMLEFARKCALSVIHLWEAPKVIIDFLNGDERKRAAAIDAAMDAAMDAAWAAARAASRDAAMDVAMDVAMDAARAAARAVASAASRDAAMAASRDAAMAVAMDAARAAARAVAVRSQRNMFSELVNKEFGIE